MKKKKHIHLKEQKQVSMDLVVDRANGIIKNAKICGFESKNNRVYTEQALKQGVHLYDGAVVNIDHLTETDVHRKLTDRLGRITNPRFVANDGIRGDFEILVSHPLAEMIFEAAERGIPLGFSHTAEGEVEDKDGVEYVVRLESITSVDVVANPATNSTFAESIGNKSKKKKGNKMQISEEQKKLLEKEDMKKAAIADDMTENEDDMEEDEDLEENEDEMEESDEKEESDDEIEEDEDEVEEDEDELEEADADVSGVDDQKSVGKVSPKLQGKDSYMPKDYVKESHKKVKAKELANLIEGAGLSVGSPVKKVLAKLTKSDAVLVIRALAEAGIQKTAAVNLKESSDGRKLPKNIFAWLKD